MRRKRLSPWDSILNRHLFDNSKVIKIGKISFDTEVIAALQHGKSILEYPESIAAGEINSIWRRLQKEMEN